MMVSMLNMVSEKYNSIMFSGNGIPQKVWPKYCLQILIKVMSIQINERLTLNLNISQTTLQNTVLFSMS